MLAAARVIGRIFGTTLSDVGGHLLPHTCSTLSDRVASFKIGRLASVQPDIVRAADALC